MKLIELRSITKVYHLGSMDVPVLNGVSLQIEAGEFIALMGSSGSGKTTLMNILGCLDRPSSGEYWLSGREVSKLSRDERAILRNKFLGFVFQNFSLLARTSALENVILPLAYAERAVPVEEAQERGRQLLERVGLHDREAHDPSQLSGGQQQRVAIARALVNKPSILFADEPTGNLDSKTSEEILHLFRELHHEGITIILVTHESEVAAHATRIIRMKDGLVTDEGSP